MVRRSLILSLVLAACQFSAPAAGTTDGGGDGGDDDAPADPDGAPVPCDVAPTWEAGLQPARTLHVSTVPGPAAPDGSPQNPYTSISAAVDAAKTAGPGTRVLLDGGTYSVGVTFSDLRGTAAAPFWLEGPATGPRAQLVGAGAGIHLLRPAYVVLRHLDLASTAQASVNVDDGGVGGSAHHVVIDDVTVASTAVTAFQITGVTDVTLRGSTASSCNRGVMLVGVQRATISRILTAATTFASVAIAGGSRDIEVRQSRFENTGFGIRIGGISDANEFRPPLAAPSTGNFEAADVRVFDNVFAGDIMDAIACLNCTRSLVAHNEIRGVIRSVFRLEQTYAVHPMLSGAAFAAAGAVRWIDNAVEVAGNPVAMTVASSPLGDAPAVASCAFSHNLWYRRSPPTSWRPSLPAPLTETAGIYDHASGYEDTGRLCAGGGAIGAGVVVPEVAGTLGGVCRPAPPSIGPSERDPGC
ncbi:MAG TPA: right-handed parallel beta-helix repeat-containing protein [Kofleriaceae bacterium]|nr:right-handed parallel beta-helix repeat-containing protein [Kofleriaceae bacterium]